MSEKKTYPLTIWVGKEHVTINGARDFGVRENSIHLANAIDQVVLSQLRQHDSVAISPGSYRITLTLVAERLPEPKEEEPKPAEGKVELEDNEVPEFED